MKTLLIGGAPNTGKTGFVGYVANYLVKDKAFNVVVCQNYDGKKISIPKVVFGANKPKDFCAYLTGKDSSGKDISVTIVSSSDYTSIINANLDFLNVYPCDIFISSIRDIGDERKYLLKSFKLSEGDYIECPLGKMSRRGDNWYTEKKWYDDAVQKMIEFILAMKPFGI